MQGAGADFFEACLASGAMVRNEIVLFAVRAYLIRPLPASNHRAALLLSCLPYGARVKDSNARLQDFPGDPAVLMLAFSCRLRLNSAGFVPHDDAGVRSVAMLPSGTAIASGEDLNVPVI